MTPVVVIVIMLAAALVGLVLLARDARAEAKRLREEIEKLEGIQGQRSRPIAGAEQGSAKGEDDPPGA